jgi:hypothetical protein
MNQETELKRAAAYVGWDVYNNDPIVHAALQGIMHGVPLLDALATAVKCLSKQNASMLKDLVTVAASRPLPVAVIESAESKNRLIRSEDGPSKGYGS